MPAANAASAAKSTPGATSAGGSTGAASVPTSDYVIGAGDVLRVIVLGRPELTTEAPVRPDGKLSLPLISEVDALGKRPMQLEQEIEARLQVYVRSPSVSVVVQQARSSQSQVTVIGQVGRPGSVPFRTGMTVLNAVLETNGLTQFAAGNRAFIIRSAGNNQQRIKVKLGSLLTQGDLSQNYPLQSGDVLVVPEARF